MLREKVAHFVVCMIWLATAAALDYTSARLAFAAWPVIKPWLPVIAFALVTPISLLASLRAFTELFIPRRRISPVTSLSQQNEEEVNTP